MRRINTPDQALRALRIALILGLSLIGACAIATEEPAFTISLAQGDCEVREYPALVVAEVSVTGDRKAAASAGFRLLAGYIFGGNTARQKIAMTAPVLQSGGNGQWLIRFIMPRGSTLESLPRPNNPRVQLHNIAPARPHGRGKVQRIGAAGQDRGENSGAGRIRECTAAAGDRFAVAGAI